MLSVLAGAKFWQAALLNEAKRLFAKQLFYWAKWPILEQPLTNFKPSLTIQIYAVVNRPKRGATRLCAERLC
jgi:hypothetical protein